MSVAENPTMEPVQKDPQQQFAIGSALGAVTLLAVLWVVLAGLPKLWGDTWHALFATNRAMQENLFLADSLLILFELMVVAGLVVALYRGLQQLTQAGLRAGIFFAAVMIFLALWIGAWLGGVMEQQFRETPALGWVVLATLVGAMLGGAGFMYLKVPGWYNLMETIEHHGWFHGHAYKGNQGVRVRRGSIVGILAVGVCGIITMSMHRMFGYELSPTNERPLGVPNDWYWLVPYSVDLGANTEKYIPLLFKVHMIMPILMGLALIWVAWRTVNVPTFADFLIATEAEMNKVSWTNRRRLVQDTVVVLTTVFLFTAFLFVVDIIWIKVLSAPGIQVLLINPKDAEKEQQKTAEW